MDESTGIGELALALAVSYETKMGLGPESLWSSLSVQQGEFFAAFGQTINDLIQRHKVDLERKWWEQTFAPNSPPHPFVAAKATNATKTRWVDGTPGYSFHICGLRKLFPNALFIHVVRDVASVVRSILNFHRLAGASSVADQQELQSLVSLSKRLSFGRTRVRSAESIPIAAGGPCGSARDLLESSFGFLGESYAPECLIPLRSKINSSDVPADFKLGEPGTDPWLSNEQRNCSAEIERNPQSSEVSTVAIDEMEATFKAQVNDRAMLRDKYTKMQTRAQRLAREINDKRTTIRMLRARHWRNRLRQLVFGRDMVS